MPIAILIEIIILPIAYLIRRKLSKNEFKNNDKRGLLNIIIFIGYSILIVCGYYVIKMSAMNHIEH